MQSPNQLSNFPDYNPYNYEPLSVIVITYL